ncbi:MAG: YraN family protein [Acidobacteriota bacterium]
MMHWDFWRSHSAKDSAAKPRAAHLALGELGEQLALEYLKAHGYRIVLTNFTVPIGYSRSGRQITGEIDIVAYDETNIPFTLAFIEVKTRTRSDIASPEAAVDARKQRQIVRAARLYRRLMYLEDEPYRYDVVGILASADAQATSSLSRGYFTEQRFSQSRWLAGRF